jgi:hypothetical protein
MEWGLIRSVHATALPFGINVFRLGTPGGAFHRRLVVEKTGCVRALTENKDSFQ